MAGPLKSGKVSSKANLSKKKFAIVVAEWNEEITGALYEGAYSSLIANGAKKANIIRKTVPGTFELTLGAQWMADQKGIDAVIVLGCVTVALTLRKYCSKPVNELLSSEAA